MSIGQTIYVVDSDSTIGNALTELLATYGIPVLSFPEPGPFLAALSGSLVEEACLILDKESAGGDGLALVRDLRGLGIGFPVLLLADSISPELRERASSLGVADVIERAHMANYVVDRLAQVLPSDTRKPGLASIPLPNGSEVRFRTMQPEDREIEQAFVKGLSAQSRYLRFFSGMKELPPKLLHDLTHPEYPDSYAVIATVHESDGDRQIGVARYSPSQVPGTVEFAVVIADEWQGYGIARHLLTTVIAAAVMAGQERIEGLVLRENKRMLRLAKDLGFSAVRGDDDISVVRVIKDLTAHHII